LIGSSEFNYPITQLLPQLGQLSAAASFYSRGAAGWYVLSSTSYLFRGAIAVVLLTPITLLMGGTLTLLIRHLVQSHADTSASAPARSRPGSCFAARPGRRSG